MITWILAALILGAAGYIIFKKIKKMKAGDFSCEGCKGGSSCASCPSCQEAVKTSEEKENNF